MRFCIMLAWDLVLLDKGSVTDHVKEYFHAYKMSQKTLEFVGKKVQSFYFGTETDYSQCVKEYANVSTSLLLFLRNSW